MLFHKVVTHRSEISLNKTFKTIIVHAIEIPQDSFVCSMV